MALSAVNCRTPVDVTPEAAPAASDGAAPDSAPTASRGSDEGAGGSPPYVNTIKWKTASELDNFGFDVYRSESPDGPFERINPQVIEGAGTTDEINSYQFVDDTIDPRQTYYYYVEDISMAGVRKRFTPIGKAPPKIQDDGRAPP